MPKGKDLILYQDDTETVLPFKFEICGHCEGHGTSSAYLGAFTREDIDDAGEEFMEDYMAGKFDRPCEHCEGGKVRVADLSKMTKAQREAWDKQCEDDRANAEMNRMERLMEGGWREEGWR